VGQRVIAMSHQLDSGRGTWADLVALPGLTALQTLNGLAVSAGERLLIAGAAGAVGGLALQLAHARGVRVDALVSRDAHAGFARDCGADLVTTDRSDSETAVTKRSFAYLCPDGRTDGPIERSGPS